MELITILSTIILIATISTFILSIGAYILYKVRSRREQNPVTNNAAPTKAELVTANDEDFEGLRKQAHVNSESETPYNTVEHGVIKTEQKIKGVEDKFKPNRNTTRRFTKYSSERFVNSDKEDLSEDLKWK